MQFKGVRGQAYRTVRSPVKLEKRSKILAVLLLMILSATTLVVQLSTYPNHDVAWVLWGTRELLHGARWGRDVIEANPPLAWYLAMPTTILAEWANLPLDWTFRAAVTLAGAISAGSLVWLGPPNQSSGRSLALCTTAGAALLLLPGREFGQREQLLVIATLPYLALCALRLGGDRGPGRGSEIFIGILAGVGVALKPYFLAVPLLAEIVLQLLGKPRPRLFRAENMAGAAVLMIYGLWLLAFEQTYLRDVIPLAREIYWEYDRSPSIILPPLLTLLVAAAPFMLVALMKRDTFGIMMAAAWCGFAVSYLAQQKGYPYHLLPVTIATLMLAASVVTSGRLRPPIRLAAGLLMTILVLICLPPLAAWWIDNRAGGARTVEIDRIRASLAKHAANGSFLVVAVHHYPTFPTAIYTSARYVSRTNSQWFLPAVVQIREGQVRPAQSAAIERHAREFILHDLRGRPNLVLIDTNSARHTMTSSNFDFLAFFKEEPEFRSEWRSYREIEPIGEYRQFVRVGERSG